MLHLRMFITVMFTDSLIRDRETVQRVMEWVARGRISV